MYVTPGVESASSKIMLLLSVQTVVVKDELRCVQHDAT